MDKFQLPTIVYAVALGLWISLPSSALSAEQAEVDSRTEKSDRTIRLPSDNRHLLWIPSDYQLRGNRVDVLVFFHGAPRVVQESVHVAGLNCVVISVNYAGLSSVYRRPFSQNRELFAQMLDEALAALRSQADFPEDVAWGELAVSSFSAGFGAIREILKTPAYFERIDAIYLVDSLYCGYVGDGTDAIEEGVVHPGLMKDFLRFAQASATGEKTMIVTHCCGPTPGYASTRETGDYLLEKLALIPQAIDVVVNLPDDLSFKPGELKLYRQAKSQGFELYGSPGGNEADHGEHLRHIAHWLPKLPLAKHAAVTATEKE